MRNPEAWTPIVDSIKRNEQSGMEQLYERFNRGIRYYLCRQLGPQELEDKVHDTFLIVVKAIQRGDLREPERLMGFVRTVVRRQVAAYIEQAVHNRLHCIELESGVSIIDRKENPETNAILRDQDGIVSRALSSLAPLHREILIRFYIDEESQSEILNALHLSPDQFRNTKHRAKKRFARLAVKAQRVPRNRANLLKHIPGR